MNKMAAQPVVASSIADPLVACIAQLAARFDMGFAMSGFSGLAVDGEGRLPLHQAEAALELVGLNGDEQRGARLPRTASAYPAILALGDQGPVVAHELRDGQLLVWRPATAQAQWEPLGVVQKSYTGRAITVFGDPTTLRDAGQPWNQRARSHWFWSEIAKTRGKFGPVLAATAMINLLALALPLFSMNVYDRVIPNRAQATLWVLAAGVTIAFVLDYALRRARTQVLDGIGRDLDLKLSQKIYGRILATPLAERRGNTGTLAARVSEYAMVRDFFASTTIVLIVDMIFLVLFVVTIAFIAGWLALVPVVAAILMGLAGLNLQRKVVHAAREAQADSGLQQTLLVESIAGLETLKSISGEAAMLGRWRTIAEMGSQSQQRLRDISSTAVSLASTFQQVSNIALIVGGYYLFASGEITMGAIIAIVMLSSRSLAPVGQFAFLLTRGQQAKQTLDSLQKLWDGADERRMGSAVLAPTIRTGHVKLEKLAFSYPDTSMASLSEIDLEIQPGERIAIIGRVASGKSTLGRVLCGLYEPSAGAMLVDGIDSRQYRPQDLREALRYVPQDAGLFTGTIKDNLAMGARGATEEQMLAALRTVGGDLFLSRDAGGFDRPVGEAGNRLSGGQRAFLSLARAFVSPAKLIYLDEPTGAMDSQTEKLFVERLSQSLTPGQTLVISTHRPALFSVCTRLIVLDNGRVVADGPCSEMIANAGVEAAS